MLCQFQAFLAFSPCAASASSYHFSSIAPPPWRCAFSQFAPVVNSAVSVLASGSNCAVKPTRLRRAAYFRSLATMSKLSRFVSIASLCLLLVGCYETYPPIKSASITHWQGGKPQGAALQLTPENIAKLSAWLQNHRWGWHPVIATYAPATLLTLTHSDGTISSANLMQKTLIVGQNQRKLSASESQELHSIIGAQNGG